MLGFRARSPVMGRNIDVSPPLFLPPFPSLKIINKILKKKVFFILIKEPSKNINVDLEVVKIKAFFFLLVLLTMRTFRKV